MKRFTTNTKRRLTLLLSIMAPLLLWSTAALLMNNPLIIPTPWETLAAMLKLVRTPEFFAATGATVVRGLIGFTLSIALGLGVGIAAGLKEWVDTLLKPLMVSIRSTPVIAVILLSLIWFSNDTAPVFIGFLIMFPIIAGNVTEGIRNVDRHLVDMARIYRVKRPRIMWEIYMPSIMPYFLSGVTSAVGIGWKAVIASEVLSQPQFAMGTRMQTAQTYLQVSDVLAWTVLAVILGYLFELIIKRIEKHALGWR